MKGTDVPVPTESEKVTYTLEPLRTDGPDALDTHDTPGVTSATLREIEIQWENTPLETTIKKATNLFACQPAADNAKSPIPLHGKLAQATFELHLAGSQLPHKLVIKPPDHAVLESAADAAPILAWLQKRHFRQLARAAALFLVATAAAFAPVTDDDDTDDDDDSTRYGCAI